MPGQDPPPARQRAIHRRSGVNGRKGPCSTAVAASYPTWPSSPAPRRPVVLPGWWRGAADQRTVAHDGDTRQRLGRRKIDRHERGTKGGWPKDLSVEHARSKNIGRIAVRPAYDLSAVGPRNRSAQHFPLLDRRHCDVPGDRSGERLGKVFRLGQFGIGDRAIRRRMRDRPLAHPKRRSVHLPALGGQVQQKFAGGGRPATD